MFNYYKRIAEYANELENDGNLKKAKHLREILRNENRCTLCGSIMIGEDRTWMCSKCRLDDDFNSENKGG